jgi:hypothetical protein
MINIAYKKDIRAASFALHPNTPIIRNEVALTRMLYAILV